MHSLYRVTSCFGMNAWYQVGGFPVTTVEPSQLWVFSSGGRNAYART
nr:MAG TPA: hypothetical protein [Caudoviricetes sp.]